MISIRLVSSNSKNILFFYDSIFTRLVARINSFIILKEILKLLYPINFETIYTVIVKDGSMSCKNYYKMISITFAKLIKKKSTIKNN